MRKKSKPGAAETTPAYQATGGRVSQWRRGQSAKPWWDAENQLLWFGNRKRVYFVRQGTYQVRLLEAFERADWPGEAIASPLEQEAGETEGEQDERLIRTVKNLNLVLAGHKMRIRFRAVANGKRVRWVYV